MAKEADYYSAHEAARLLRISPTLVDLSGVTFMDSSCVRERAAWRLLHSGLAGLATPSWQARASFSACGLSGGPGPPPRTQDLPEPSGATG